MVLGAGIAITIDPFSILSANNLNDEPLKISVTFDNNKGFLKSGLSFPYFSKLSLYVIFWNGGFVTLHFSVNSVKTWNKTGSKALKTSSWVTKDISKSSW